MWIPNSTFQLVRALLVATAVVAESISICSNAPDAIVPDGCASYGALDALNNKIQPIVHDITQNTDYFSYYRLDLYGRTCPFWSEDDGTCANIACSVTTIDDENSIPPIWRAEELSKLAGPKASHPKGKKAQEPSPLSGALGTDTEESCVVEVEDECDERDYCVPEDESKGSNGDYVSLVENPERFTGYAGAGAANVWESIYRENCFLKPKPADYSDPNEASRNFLNMLQDKGKHEIVASRGKPALAELEVDDECLEKRVFYRVISGMHSSISMHLCWDYLNQTTGEWGPNLDCFINRFQGNAERLQNIYFNYGILLRAVSKLRNYIPVYTFCSGDTAQNLATKARVLALANAIPRGTEIFDESGMFQDDMAGIKEDFRNRFRNVSRVMDCVGCDKCRLWGKVQTQGYGTALKVLFEFDEDKGIEENPLLRRTELVALVNTLGRVSHSLLALQNFQKMWEVRNATATADALPEVKVAKVQQKEEIEEKADEEEEEEEITLRMRFDHEWALIKYATRDVVQVYIDLPGVLYRLALSKISNIWDNHLGRTPAEYYQPKRQARRAEL